MTEELKARIAQINAGTTPAGYKKTKVGIVPEDWEEKKGTDLFSYIRNGFVGTVSPYYVPNGHTYIQGNNIKDGKIIPDNMMYVNDEFQLSHQNSILHTGDIIVIQSGDAGKNAVVTPEYENANCHALIIMTPYSETNTMYISYLLNSPLGMNMIKGFITGNVLHHILASDYKKLRYILPPLPEQQKIAEILTAQDEVIALLQKQIELKQQQKKYLMQKLLSGEVRVGSGEWKTVRLNEICTFINGRAYKQEELLDEGKYPVLRVGNLFTKGDWYYSDLELSDEKYIDNGDLIFAWSASLSPFIWNGSKVIYHYHIWKIDDLRGVDKMFLYLYLQYDVEKMQTQTQGGTMAHITKETMEKRKIALPPLPEQEKIAEILSAQDKEIELLQQQLALEQQKKKALMQLLLTGKVRCK